MEATAESGRPNEALRQSSARSLKSEQSGRPREDEAFANHDAWFLLAEEAKVPKQLARALQPPGDAGILAS